MKMAVVITIYSCVLAGLVAVIFVREAKIRDVREKTAAELNAQRQITATLLNLLQNPAPTTPPDKLIESIGGVLYKMTGADTVAQTVQGTETPNIEEDHYFPDVEFDEWLGNEGIPPTAGWWSPPKNDENNENVN
jgi:hypothetical protein